VRYLRKLYNDNQVVNIPKSFVSSWDFVINSPEFLEKSRQHNDCGTGLVYVRMVDEKGERVVNDKAHMSYSDMKKSLRDKAISNVFVIFDSIISETAGVTGSPEEKTVSLISNLGNKIYYFGESKNIVEESDCGITKTCIVVDAMFRKKPTKLYFPVHDDEGWKTIKDLERNEYVSFSGTRIERRYKEGKDIVEDYVYFVNEYKVFQDTFSDVATVIPSIKKVSDLTPFLNVSTKQPMYCEELNKIILYDVFYVKEGEPVFNLIIYGEGGSGKSSCTQIHGLMFSNDGNYIDMTQTTVAGLVISYGDKARPGLLIDPINYTKVVDEIFRRSTGDASSKGKVDPSNEIRFLLERLMGIVLRDKKGIAGSGKGALEKGKGYMRDSFLACDNMVAEVRNAFCSFVRDGGLLRRFSFLRITDIDKIGVQEADIRPSSTDMMDAAEERYEAMGLSGHLVKRFSRWFRRVAAKVNLSGKKAKLEAESVQHGCLKGLWNEIYSGQKGLDDEQTFNEFFVKWISTQNLIPSYEALVRCCAVARCVEQCNDQRLPEIIVEDQDYDEAKILFKRLFEDSLNIYRTGVAKWMMARKMDTTYGGM
jgi:hypothetical protein